jgi:exopolysaccharide biosynthesis polyprenyl glycosylphosphotransferase
MYRRRLLLDSLKLFDLVLMAGSFVFSMLVISSGLKLGSFADLLAMRIKLANFAIFVGFTISWHAIFSLSKLYHSHRLSSVHQEAIDITKATLAGTLVLLAGSVVLNMRLVTPSFLAFFWASTTLGAIVSRIILRFMLARFRSRGRNLRHVIIVGANHRALAFAKETDSKPELGYIFRGFVDDTTMSDEIGTAKYPLVAGLKDLQEFLRQNVVDEVVIALPLKSSYAQAADIVAICEEQGVVVRFLSNLFNVRTAQTRADYIAGQEITTITTSNMDGLSLLLKRLIDLFGSCLLLAVLSPLFLIVALLVKITSPGPVFFVQERIGINKRWFKLIKFRTMVSGAEKKIHELEHLNEIKGAAFKIKDDPRITRIGRFLRRASIDELPQLFNVFKGDMSLVGPRPLTIRDYMRFDEDWHRRRFSVKPGITCLWQCNGRSKVSFDHWMELDMEYIDNWSLGLDFKILLKTVPAVLRGSGAA